MAKLEGVYMADKVACQGKVTYLWTHPNNSDFTGTNIIYLLSEFICGMRRLCCE